MDTFCWTIAIEQSRWTRKVALHVLGCAIALIALTDRLYAAPAAQKEADPQRAKIEKILDAPVTVEFVETPLRDVAEFVTRKFGIELQLDSKVLADVGVGGESPVTLSVHDISLRSALKLITRQLELTHVYADGVILITTPENEETHFRRLVSYDVRTLVEVKDDESATGTNVEQLMLAIRGNVEPNTWLEVGGFATIEYQEGFLKVDQVDSCHRQIADLLAGLRTLPALGDPRIGKVHSCPMREEENANYARIVKFLDRPVVAMKVEHSLATIAGSLAKRFQINVLLDEKAFSEVGFSSDEKIRGDISNTSMYSGLHRMLDGWWRERKGSDLAFMICDEVLLITTPEVAETHLNLRIYPVFDLVGLPVDAPASAVTEKLTALRKRIVDLISPDSWDEVGGAGSAYPLAQQGVLVVSQTDAVHYQLQQLFALIRETKPN